MKVQKILLPIIILIGVLSFFSIFIVKEVNKFTKSGVSAVYQTFRLTCNACVTIIAGKYRHIKVSDYS